MAEVPKQVKDFAPRTRKAFTEDFKFILFLLSFGLGVYILLELAPKIRELDLVECLNRMVLNPKLKEVLTRDITRYINEQGPLMRHLLRSETIENPEMKKVVTDWAIERAKECCAYPGVTEAMGNLISAAVELPSTQFVVGSALIDVLKREDVQKAALDFVQKTLSHPDVKAQVATVTKETFESLSGDPQVQTDLWLFVKKALLPKWIASVSPPAEVNTSTTPMHHSWASKLKLSGKKT